LVGVTHPHFKSQCHVCLSSTEPLPVKLVALRTHAVISNDFGSPRNFATEFVNTTHTHAHARTHHARTHARARAHTHTHTHTEIYNMQNLSLGQDCKLAYQIRKKKLSQKHIDKSV